MEPRESAKGGFRTPLGADGAQGLDYLREE